MGMISFFKTPNPKRFGYSPVFYDAQKEALKEREKQIRQEMGLTSEDDQRVSLIKGQFRRHFESKKRQKSGNNRNLRLVVIFTILCLLSYYIIYF